VGEQSHDKPNDHPEHPHGTPPGQDPEFVPPGQDKPNPDEEEPHPAHPIVEPDEEEET
jgi:hypothetical protein